jgi:hypothetical protein
MMSFLITAVLPADDDRFAFISLTIVLLVGIVTAAVARRHRRASVRAEAPTSLPTP